MSSSGDNIVRGMFPKQSEDVAMKPNAEALARSVLQAFSPEVLAILNATISAPDNEFTNEYGVDLIKVASDCKQLVWALDKGIIEKHAELLAPEFNVEKAHAAIQRRIIALLSTVAYAVPKLLFAANPGERDASLSPVNEIGLAAYDLALAMQRTPDEMSATLESCRERLADAAIALAEIPQATNVVAFNAPRTRDSRHSLAKIGEAMSEAVNKAIV